MGQCGGGISEQNGDEDFPPQGGLGCCSELKVRRDGPVPSPTNIEVVARAAGTTDHTQGLAIDRSGRYDGEVLSGKPHGHGRLYYNGGAQYRGNFVTGKRCGQGELSLHDRRFDIPFSYEGDWYDGLPNGCGTAHWEDGHYYSGQHAHGALHGEGTFHWPGAIYSGQFRDVSLDRHGCYTWSDGSAYSGQWRGNRPHGQGLLTSRECRAICTYKDGVLVDVVWDTGTSSGAAKGGPGVSPEALSDEVFLPRPLPRCDTMALAAA